MRYTKHKLIGSAALILSVAFPVPTRAAPGNVEMTWMSIANWYFTIGDKRILMDGYVTRVPQSLFVAPPAYPWDVYAYTVRPYDIDVTSIARVRDAIVGADKVDFILTGHSHFDHSWDTATWAKLTGAPMIGGASSCMQALAQGILAAQCRSVSGGENISLGGGITMHVVRFNHSGDGRNPIQHFARELYRPPVPDPSTGGYRAGVGEDYPNGGGSRAFLFTLDGPDGRLAFFVSGSASAFDLDKDIIVDGVNHGSPVLNLTAAMKDAGVTHVDVWIGTGGSAVAERIVPVLRPKVYIPSHWDGLFNPLWAGMPYPFKDDALEAYLKAENVELVRPTQYFDKYVLTHNGVTVDANHALKRKLGLADSQPFGKAMLDAVTNVASTRVGDDCGEGFTLQNDWSKALALMAPKP